MDEKRTLNEVIAIYTFEPSLRDIFVEGRTDKNFVEWYLRANGFRNVTVYSIELIDIPNHVIQKHNLAVGSNRSRVLALACELAEHFPVSLRVLCLADRDYEDYRSSVRPSCYLSFTDCNALDLYALTPNSIDKFISVAVSGLPLSASNLMDALKSILQDVYAIRLANELLEWGMEWIPFTRYVKVERGIISFDEMRLVRAYLQKNKRWQDRSLFQGKVREAKVLLSLDAGHSIRGHDLSHLLLHIIRHMRKDRKYGNSETLEGSLMASLECRDLERFPFFRRIVELATTS